jgi:protein involved in polysaccharide export with SLBB domain
MTRKSRYLVAGLIFCGLTVRLVSAPVFAPVDEFPQPLPEAASTKTMALSETDQGELTIHKQEREEFEQAQQFAVQKQVDITAAQHTLDLLTEQEATRQQEVTKARAKVAAAKERLNQASAVGVTEEVEKWRSETEYWETRVKSAILEQEKIESEINETVQSLQIAIKGNPESDLLVPGDSVEVFVSEDDSFNGVYPIRRGGYILLPRVGRVTLAGKNLAAAEKTVKEALQVNQLKQATVMVERPQGGGSGTESVIYLAGEFTHPGAWKIPPALSPTLVTTILRSGGLTAAADLTKVRLLRLIGGQAIVEQVNVQAILNGAGLPADVNLQPGDIIMVPPYANVVYITGSVMHPGALRLLPDDELTAYSAILRAGGFSRFANRSGVYILRDRGNGVKRKIPVNIKALQAGSRSDVILQSKDIVVVPEKFFSF